MKLHLPSGLRKALLACLAALALPVTTFASGSALFGSAAVVSFITADLSAADESSISFDDDEEDADDEEALPILYSGEYDIAPIAWQQPDAFPEDGVYTNAPSNSNLDSLEGNLLSATLGGNATFTYNGGAGKSLKLKKSGPNSATTLNGSLSVTNLWLNGETPDWGNKDANHFIISSANFLTADISNVYISKVGVRFTSGNAQTGLTANFYLGGVPDLNASGKGKTGLNTGSWENIVNWLDANVETTGSLYIMEDTSMVYVAAHFSARSLNGYADFTIGGNSNSAAAYLELTEGGNSTGKLIFGSVQNSNNPTEVRFGNTLSLNGVGGAFAQFVGLDDAAVLRITGADGEASSITFSGVILEMDSSASHTFTDSVLDKVRLGEGSVLTLAGTGSVNLLLADSVASRELVLSENAAVSIKGVESGMTLSKLTLHSGSSLALADSQNVTINELVVGDDGATLILSLADLAKVNINSRISGSGTLYIELADLLLPENFTTGYELFGTSYDSSWNIELRGNHFGRQYLALNDQGCLILNGYEGENLWAGGVVEGDSHVWRTGGTGWQNNDTVSSDSFLENDDVRFNLSDSSVATSVTIDAAGVKTTKFQIEQGDWNFSGGSLTVAVATIADGASAIFSNSAFTFGKLTGGGSLTFSGYLPTFGDVSEFSGSLELNTAYSLAGDMAFASGGTLFMNGAKLQMNAHTLKGNLKLNPENATTEALVMGSGGVIDGDLILAADSYIRTGVGSSMTGDVIGNGHMLYIWDSNFTIEGSVKNISQIKLRLCSLIIDGDIDADSISGDTFTLVGANNSNDGNLTLNGDVSGINKFSATWYVGNELFIDFHGSLTLSGETEFNTVGSNADKSSMRVTGSLIGDSSAVIKKIGAGYMNLSGDLSQYEGALNVQAGKVNVSSALSLSGLDVASGATLNITGATVSVVNNGTHTFAGALTYGTGGTLNLTLADSSVLNVEKALSVNGTFAVLGNASLSINVGSVGTDTPALTFSSYTDSLFSSLTIGLTNVGAYSSNWSFNLFGGLGDIQWTDETWNAFAQAVLGALDDTELKNVSNKYSFKLDRDGVLSIELLASGDVTWNGGNNGTWEVGCDGWEEDATTWEDLSNVTFQSDGGEVTVGGDNGVAAGSMTIKGGEWSFSGAALSVDNGLTVGTEDGAATHVTFNNAVTISGGLTLQGSTAGTDNEITLSSLTFNDSVLFSGDVAIANGVVTLNGATTARQGLSIGQDGHLVADTSSLTAGALSLGTVTVESGGTFTLTSNAANDINPFSNVSFHGEGTIVFNIVGYGDNNLAIGGRPFSLIKEMVNSSSVGSLDTTGIHTLKLQGSSCTVPLHIGNNNADTIKVFTNIAHLYVEGITLRIGASPFTYAQGRLVDASGAQIQNTIHIAGDGNTTSGVLSVPNDSVSIAWDIQLEKDSTISADSNTATVTGALRMEGHTLTIRNGVWSFANVAGTTGDVVVNGGTLRFNSTSDIEVAKNINLSGGNLDLGGSGVVYTAASLEGAAGRSVSKNGDGSATLKLNNSDSSSAAKTFSGTVAANITAQLAGGAWKFAGTANGALAVSGGNLTLTGSSINNGLTASGGTVEFANTVNIANRTVDLSGATSLSVVSGASLSIAVAGYSADATAENALAVLSLSATQLSSLLTNGLDITLTRTDAWAEGDSLYLFHLSEGSIDSTLLAALKTHLSLTGLDTSLYSWNVSETGILSIDVVQVEGLVWTDGDGTWSDDNTGTTHWSGGAQFTSNSDVIFGSQGATGGTIEVVGDEAAYNMLNVGDVTIAHGAFTFDLKDGVLLSLMNMNRQDWAGELTINEGASLTLIGERDSDNNEAGLSIFNGTLIVNGSFEIGSADATLTVSSVTGTNENAVFRLNYATSADEAVRIFIYAFSSYAGSVQISNGFFNLDNQLANIGSKVIVDSSGSLEVAADMSKTLDLGRTADGDALVIGAAGIELSGTINLLADTSVKGSSNGAATISGSLNGGNHALTVNGGSLNLTGALSSMTTLTLSNSAVVTLNYSGNGTDAVFSEVALGGGTLSVGDRTGGVVIGSLSGSGTVNAASASGTCTLVINGGASKSTAAAINGIALVKSGTGTQTLTGVYNGKGITVNGGTLAINSGANTSISGGLEIASGSTFDSSNANNVITVSGALSGAGTLWLRQGAVTLAGGGTSSVVLDLRNNVTLKLGQNLTVGGIQNSSWTGGDASMQTISLADGVSAAVLTLNVSENKTVRDEAGGYTKLSLADGITLVKTGTATQTLRGLKASKVQVTNGTLELKSDSTWDSNAAYAVANMEVSGGAKLLVDKTSWEATGMTLTLDNGIFETKCATVGDGNTVTLNMGTLKLGNGGGRVNWLSAANTLQQQISFAKLTGSGVLTVGDISRNGETNYQQFVLKSASSQTNVIENYNGTLQSAVINGATPGGYGQGGFYLGGVVSQESGFDARISMTDGAVYVARTMLSKVGAGSLNISKLKVHANSGGLKMNYGGSFSLGSIEIENNAKFIYDDDTALTGLLTWDISALDNLSSIRVDLTDVDSDKYSIVDGTWYDLGIVDGDGTHTDLSAIKDKLELVDIVLEAGEDVYLEWREVGSEQHLHISMGDHSFTESQWDAAWGDDAENGPDAGTMQKHVYNGTGDLVLEDGESGIYNEQTMNLVRITGGGSETASVIGGALYTDESDIDSLNKDTWISLLEGEDTTARFHVLVGASSCEASSATPPTQASDAEGFTGNTHIQLRGGEVDYVVGGNHVTNSAFYFRGDSYISVLADSVVNGGIVGGSTLTKGSASENQIFEFEGNSHIYIYQALGNMADAEDTPRIQLGAGDTGSRFTAVVGGNAWVQLPVGEAGGMAPTFKGNSYIVVDLTDEEKSAGGVFAKEIIGGNYTAFKGANASENDADRSTIFEGSTFITITAANTDAFTGGISGASRRASGGGGETLFLGSTDVDITGGSFSEAIAGGMWFEETASGSHTSLLEGDTSVTLNDGSFWRVVGGSYSLQGSAGAGEVQVGDSLVTINGGNFQSNGSDYAQWDIGFVAGGDFYRNNSGTQHSHVGHASVVVNGGTFRSVHIVGGDYANASTPSGETQNQMKTVISGSSNVSIGGAGKTVDIIGLVAGGSYLTDEGAGGSVAVAETQVTIGSGAVLNHNDGHPKHAGLAVVGGHVLIDESDIATGAAGGHEAVVGSWVSADDGGTPELKLGSATITVQGTAEIVGDIVGGSYASASTGTNALRSGDVSLRLTGGSVTGSIYGGHYTESVNTPDVLEIGNITIDVNGTAVQNGNIVGGGRRAVVNDAVGHSSQGAIVVNLSSGSLTGGNVYAAGYNSSADEGAALTTTESTTVNISGDFIFGGSDDMIISGGYGRANDGLSRGVITGDAVLNITAANASIRSNITFAHFNKVNTAADVVVGTDMYVLRKSDTAADNLFTKGGAGTLSVSSLVMWNSTETQVKDYVGSLAVDGGALALTGNRTLTIAGSLSFNMDNLKLNDASTAWLRAGAGLIEVDGLASLDLILNDVSHIELGNYYLISGLASSITQSSLSQFFSYDLDSLSALSDLYQYELLVENGCLILSVLDKAENSKWVWKGSDTSSGEDMVWGNDPSNWSQNEESPNGHDVFFEGEGSGSISINGVVSPRSVWVKKGSYEFIAYDDDSQGLNLDESDASDSNSREAGELAVGSGNASDHAELKLSLKNAYIGKAMMLSGGTLTLNHAAALNEQTQIVFSGGALAYETGAAAIHDVSRHVVAEGDGTIIRVRVGAEASAPSASATDLSIAWGAEGETREVNNGINLALNTGIEKTGVDTFSLIWRENADAELKGSISALEGTLEYVLHAKDHTVRFLGDGDIQVGRGSASAVSGYSVASMGAEQDSARVIFSFAAGQEGTMEIAKAFSGDGVAQIGSAADAGSYLISADNSSFGGTILLLGSSEAGAGLVTAASSSSFGGAQTTLALAGRSFAFAENADESSVYVKEIIAEAGTTTFVGGVDATGINASITLAAPLVGSGEVANALGGFHHIITGSLSDFSGSIIAGASATGNGERSTWTLTGSGYVDIQSTLAGTGAIILDYSGDVRLTGRVGSDDGANNSVSLENHSAASKVILADAGTSGNGKNTSTGSLIGSFVLGDDTAAGSWAGQVVDGSFELVNGSLANGITTLTQGSVLTVHTATSKGGSVVNAGGTEASLISDIVIQAGGHLTGVSGKLSIGEGEGMATTWLFFDAKNVGRTAGNLRTDYLLDIDGGTTVVNTEGFVLDFSVDGFMQVLNTVIDNVGSAWLHVANGGLSIDPKSYSLLLATEDARAYRADSLVGLLYNLGFSVEGVSGGDLIITGDASEIYLVDSDANKSKSHSVNGYNVLTLYKATVIAAGESLELSLSGQPREGSLDAIAGGALVNNLVGAEGAAFHITNEGDIKDRVTVILNNEARRINNTEGYDETRAQNTVYEGELYGSAGVDLVKSGAGTLTIGCSSTHSGGLHLADGDVELRQGGLRLTGAENSFHRLTLNWQGEAAENENRVVTLDSGHTEMDTIFEASEEEGAILLQGGAQLTLNRNVSLEKTGISSGDAQGGVVTISSGATLSLSADHAQLTGISAEVESGATLKLGSTALNSLTGLSGYGTLSASKGAQLDITGGGSVFSGALTGAGSLMVSESAVFTLKGVTGGSRTSSWSLQNTGNLTIDISEAKDKLWFSELTLSKGSTTTLILNTDLGNSSLLGGNELVIEQGAKLIISSVGVNELSGSSIALAEFNGDEDSLRLAEGDISLSGLAFLRYTAGDLHFENGMLVLGLLENKNNVFVTPDMDKNACAGAELLWDIVDQSSDGWKYIQANPLGHLAFITDVMRAAYEKGPEAVAGMASTLAAVAGASTSTLSSALSQDIQRQLNSLRNRSAMSEPAYRESHGPDFHLWLTGESSYHKLDASGLAPGYTLNGWGGSVGVDIDISPRTTTGLALTAMYSDLKTSSADNGRGDIDTSYLSAYARTTQGSWTHTFVASVGTANVKLNRSVNYGGIFGSSVTQGSTDGMAVGAMYEVGYSIVMNQSASVLLQPVFNIQYSHASVSGYTETGSDAGLRVDGMKHDTFTLGLGARLQSIVGENAFNRVAVFEARALVKAELGDRSGSASTSFIHAGHTVGVESAEVGAVGLEIGAGLSVPIRRNGGTIFFDASTEFRSGYSDLNASAGYRINF